MNTNNALSSVNALNELKTYLLATLDEHLFFARLSQHLLEATGETRVIIAKAFDDGRSQIIAMNGEAVRDEEILPQGKGASGYVIKTKKAYYSNNVRRDPLLSQLRYEEDIHAELSLPITIQGAVMATIHLQSNRAHRQFNDADAGHVIQLVHELDRPLTNMRMFLAAKHLNQELLKKIEVREQEASINKELNLENTLVQQSQLIGNGRAWIDVLEMANRLAPTDIPVLIEGETGTGKETIAKRIHQQSKRSAQTIVVANCHCGNQGENAALVEAEIFGQDNRKGSLEVANNGTIILDDVSELTPSLQNKLLQVMTKGLATRLGNNQVYSINIRFISLTRKNLKKQVEDGRFREDLFYRLSTATLKTPSLKERRDDIKLLSEHFLNENRGRNEAKALTSGALRMLTEYSWPGNIRELKNIMERVAVLADGQFIDESVLPLNLKEAPAAEIQMRRPETFIELTLAEIEKTHILKTLEHLNNNKTRTAKSLGITVKTLYNKLHSYGVVIGTDNFEA